MIDENPSGLTKEFVLTFILMIGTTMLYFSEAPWFCYAGVFLFYLMIMLVWFKDWNDANYTTNETEDKK